MSTSADPVRVNVKTMIMLGGCRVLPGERVLPRHLAESAIRDGFASAMDDDKKTKLTKKPQGITL